MCLHDFGFNLCSIFMLTCSCDERRRKEKQQCTWFDVALNVWDFKIHFTAHQKRHDTTYETDENNQFD
jgi:hypothetical protein